MSVPLTIAEAAQAAARPARAVSEAAAVTAGVEVALAADRRGWGDRLLAHLRDLPPTATGQRELLAALVEEFYAAADEIDHGAGGTPAVPDRYTPYRGELPRPAGDSRPRSVAGVGRCTRCGGTTWQHQARDICGRCGHSTQHDAPEFGLAARSA